VGLDQGDEFFYAVDVGFEVVGFEPNPKSFGQIALKCLALPTCEVVDLKKTTFPMNRKPGMSYLINAGAGASNVSMEMSLDGPAGSFVGIAGNADSEKTTVPVFRVDHIINEDVFLFKVDTQGFDHFVLEGASNIFKNHAVRQVIFEVDPYTMSQLGLNIRQSLTMLQTFGMLCFTDRSDNQGCEYLGDSAKGFEALFFENIKVANSGKWAKCWEDFLCLNIEKIYPGAIPPLLYPDPPSTPDNSE
jgi:FkbM family methyltransferase